MQKLRNCLVAACLPIFASCSTASDITPPQTSYVGVPASLMDRCIVNDVALDTVADLVISRNRWKDGHDRCAAKIDSIRKHDREMREAAKDGADSN